MKEYPAPWRLGQIEYCPVNDDKNHYLFERYQDRAELLLPKSSLWWTTG